MLVPRFGVFTHLVYDRDSDKLSRDEKMLLQKKDILYCNKTLATNVMSNRRIEGARAFLVEYYSHRSCFRN